MKESLVQQLWWFLICQILTGSTSRQYTETHSYTIVPKRFDKFLTGKANIRSQYIVQRYRLLHHKTFTNLQILGDKWCAEWRTGSNTWGKKSSATVTAATNEGLVLSKLTCCFALDSHTRQALSRSAVVYCHNYLNIPNVNPLKSNSIISQKCM